MRNHRIYTLATLFILTAIYSAVWAQQVHVNVTRLQNPLPPQITTYYENPGRFFSVSITNTDTKVPVPVRLEFSLVGPIEGGMDVWPASSSSYFMLSSNRSLPTGFIIAPGQTRFISSMELSQHMMSYPTSSYYAGGAISEAMSTAKEGVFGLLDEGHYGIKMVAKTNYDGEAGDVIGESTAYFDICYSATAPSFTYPQSEGFDFTAEYDVIRFPVEYAHFEWTVPQFNLQSLARNRQFTYEFKLYRMLPNQSPEEAVASNGIAFQQPGLLTPFCNIPYNVVENLKRSGTKHFVAQVTATPIVSDDHNPDYTQINNSGKSALMILKLTDDDMENVGVVDNGLTIEEGDKGEQGFKVTIEPKFNKLTNELAPYFETPSKLFRLTVENKTGEDQTISLLLQFFKDNWGVCPSPNKQHSTKSLTIMSGETITLSDEQLDDLAGGYPYSDIIAFKAKTGFIIGKPAQNTFPGTEYTVSARVCKFTGKPVLREEALGSARADFVTDGEVAIDDIFKITFESRIDPVPTDVSTLFTHPSRHFTATIENLSSIAYDLRPVLSFRLLGDTIYMGGYIRRLNESLHIEPGEVLEFSDMNIDEMCGGFTEIYKIYDEDEHTDTIQDFSTVLPAPDGNTVQLSLFDANLLRTLYPNDKDYTSKSLLQDATLDFSSSASAFMGDVDVTITPKSTPMPGNIGAYFNKTSQLFDVTLTNTTNRMLKVSPRLMYKLTDDGSIQKINGTPYSQYYIALKPRTSYTLTEDDHRTFFTSKSILSYAVNQEGEFADIPDTIHIVPNFFNDEDGLISLDEKNYAHIDIFDYDLLQMDKENPSDAIRGKGDCEFSASADYQLFDVSVGITPLMNPMPGDGAAYARMPGKLFGITLTNNTDKPIRGIPSIRYKFKDKTYVYTPHAEQYGKEYRLLEPKAKVTLPANEFTRMAGGERMIRTGGKEKSDTLETLDDILDFEAENSVCVLVVDYDTLNALPKDTPDLMTRILRGAASHDFMADSTVHIGDVTITIAPRDDKMSDKATDYFTTPGKYFDVKLRNTGGSEQKVSLRLTLNEKYYGVSDSTLILPPDSTVTLTEEMLNNLCGGIPSERIFQLDTIDNNIQRKVAQEMKLLDGQNSIQALVWQLPKDQQLATMGENVDTLSLESTTFITSFRDVQIGEFILSILESKPVAKKDSCYSGKGYITWNAMGFPIKIAVEFDTLYINKESVAYRGLVKSAKKEELLNFAPFELFESKIDSLGAGELGTEVKNMLAGSEFATYYTYVTETMEAIPMTFVEGSPALQLPVKLPESVSKKSPVDIQLLSMEFRPDKASMNLIAQFTLPESNYVNTAENILVFGSPHLGMSDSTLIPKTGDLALLTDLTIKDPSTGFNITFLAPGSVDIETWDAELGNNGCFVKWENGEFADFVVDAKMAIPSSDIVKVVDGAVQDSIAPDIRLTASISDKEDWIAQVRFDAFEHVDAPGYTFTIGGSTVGVLYDHSKSKAPDGMTMDAFPKDYDWKLTGINEKHSEDEKFKEWQGFYFEKLSVAFPEFIELNNSGEDKRLSIEANKIIYDESGFSMTLAATNVLDQSTASMGGWGITLDEVYLSVLQNDFGNFGFNGRFDVPLLDGQIGYDAKVAYVDKGKETINNSPDPENTQAGSGSSTDDDDDTPAEKVLKVVFETRQVDSLSLDFFVGTMDFEKDNTYFNVTYLDGNTDVELSLSGEINIAGSKSDKSSVGFALPGIGFHRMRLANFVSKEEIQGNAYHFETADQSFCFDLGRWSLGGVTLGGGGGSGNNEQANNSGSGGSGNDNSNSSNNNNNNNNNNSGSDSDNKDSSDDASKLDTEVEYGLNVAGFSIGLDEFSIATRTEGEETQIGLYIKAKMSLVECVSATAGFTIWASFDMDTKNADYEGATFNDIGVGASIGGIVIDGTFSVKNDDEYGDGYCGMLKIALPGNLFTFNAEGGYFKKVQNDPEVSNYGKKVSWGYLEIAAGGKALSSIQPVGITELSGGFYFNCNDQKQMQYGYYGLMLGVGLSFSDESVVAGKFTLQCFYDCEKDRLGRLSLRGTAHMVGGGTNKDGLLNAEMLIIYENTYEGATETRAASGEEYFQMTASVDASADMTSVAQKLVSEYVPVENLSMIAPGLGDAFGQDDEDIAAADAERNRDASDEDAKSKLKASAGAKFNFDLKITFKSPEITDGKPKWHLWLGKPQPEDQRCQVTFIDFQLGDKDDAVAAWAKVYVNAYFCIGNEMPVGPDGNVLPPIPAEVQEFLDGKDVNGNTQNLTSKAQQLRNEQVNKMINNAKGGLMFGAAAGASFGANLMIAYFDVSAMAGFDIALVKLADGATRCANTGREMRGLNGYYATGQAYIKLEGEIGLMIDLWLFQGKIALVKAGIGAMLQVGFAHPTWFYGKMRAKCSLFNGLIKFNKAIEIEAGDVCVPYYANPLADIEIFGDIYPNYDNKTDGWDEEKMVSPYAVPRFATNMQMDTPIRLLDETQNAILVASEYDTSGGGAQNAERTYRFMLRPGGHLVETYASPNASRNGAPYVTATNTSGDRTNYTLNIGALKENTCYKVTLYGYAQEKKNGIWGDPWFTDESSNYYPYQKAWGDTCEFYFRTTELPPYLTINDIALAPGHSIEDYDYAYFHELEKPYLAMRRSRANLFKQGYEMKLVYEYKDQGIWKSGPQVPISEVIEEDKSKGTKYITWKVADGYFPLPGQFNRTNIQKAVEKGLRVRILRINTSKYNQYIKDATDKIVKESIQYNNAQTRDNILGKGVSARSSRSTVRTLAGTATSSTSSTSSTPRTLGGRASIVLPTQEETVNLGDIFEGFENEMVTERQKDEIERKVKEFEQSVNMDDFTELMYEYTVTGAYPYNTLSTHLAEISDKTKMTTLRGSYAYLTKVDGYSQGNNYDSFFLGLNKQNTTPASAFTYWSSYAFFPGIKMPQYDYDKSVPGGVLSSESATYSVKTTGTFASLYSKPTVGGDWLYGAPVYLSGGTLRWNSDWTMNSNGEWVPAKSLDSQTRFEDIRKVFVPNSVPYQSYERKKVMKTYTVPSDKYKWPVLYKNMTQYVEAQAVLVELFTEDIRDAAKSFESKAVKERTDTKVKVDDGKAREWSKTWHNFNKIVSVNGASSQMNIEWHYYQIPYVYGILNDKTKDLFTMVLAPSTYNPMTVIKNFFKPFNSKDYLLDKVKMGFLIVRPNRYDVNNNDGTRQTGLAVSEDMERYNTYSFDIDPFNSTKDLIYYNNNQ